MKTPPHKYAQGAVLIFALVTVLLMSIVGGTIMKAGIFHERLTTNNHLDALTFQAAESVIAATMVDIDASPVLRKKLMEGASHQTCFSSSGEVLYACGNQGSIATSNNANKTKQTIAMTTLAQTTYQGMSPVMGFDVDTLAYYRFSTEGRAHFAEKSTLPFGHLNLQVWQTLGATTGVFNQY